MNAQIPVQFLNTNPNSKATFRPGGDAQYVSYEVQGVVNSIVDENHGDEDFETYYRTLIKSMSANFDFSPALKAKFVRAANRVVDVELDRIAKKVLKETRKAAKPAKAKREVIEVIDYGTVKVGRWEYPAREVKYSDDTSLVQRNAKRDGSGEWIDIAK